VKVESSTVKKLKITEIESLDTITVILEDIGPRQGKIIIECYSESWASYWGGMGDRTIAEFFCSCGNDYLIGNLSSTKSTVIDDDAIEEAAKKIILRLRRDGEIDSVEAREMFDEVDGYGPDIANDYKLLHRVYGDEWWYALPHKMNHEYEYLERICNAVKFGIQQDAAAR
jgi:hypothetical protein